jgi:hypothetical protein
MNRILLGEFLLWCAVINYLVLVLWFLVFVLAHEWLYNLHGRWFKLTRNQFDSLHYGGMAVYKVGILLLNLVPLAALYVIARRAL